MRDIIRNEYIRGTTSAVMASKKITEKRLKPCQENERVAHSDKNA